MNDIKVGDMLWVSIKGASYDYGYGEVVETWFSTHYNVQVFNFTCLVNGGLRMGHADNVVEKPTGRMVAKLSHAQIALSEVLKEKR